MPAATSVTENLRTVRDTVAAAAARAGRRAEEIEIVAVSKTHPPETVRAATEAGQTLFGESRVQEAAAKIPLLPGRLRWHFIGHLQSNKVRAALPLFDLFHSIDSLALAKEMQRIAQGVGVFSSVLLEVNVAGEGTKFGFKPDELRTAMEELLALDRLQIGGLMAMAPFHPDAEHSRPFFVRLRELRDALTQEFGAGLPQLSMGMSGDYGVAVEEGATLVRVGSAIFGERSGKAWRPTREDGAAGDFSQD
jgi:pyridoxal phosphate enzyme (YggS family)